MLVAVTAVDSDVCMCLQCGKPLHRSEPLNFIDNANPGRGGCHARCVDAYHAARRALEIELPPARAIDSFATSTIMASIG